MNTPPKAVQMLGVHKAFDGVAVLHDVDFEVDQGEVHALAGGNGAGKSTLMKILQGVYSMDEGSILVKGEPVQIAFNARYLQDALQNVDADQLAMEFSGPLSPGVLRRVGDDDYVHVIMPVRTPS